MGDHQTAASEGGGQWRRHSLPESVGSREGKGLNKNLKEDLGVKKHV